MTTPRLFQLEDMFKFNHIVLDPLVEVYSLPFLLPKILEYPDLVLSAVAPDDRLMGFILGTRIMDSKETHFIGEGKEKIASHGHISALAVAHEYRRLGLGSGLMEIIRKLLDTFKDPYVDLFVRQKNVSAICLYETLGYVKYRWLPQYYANDHGYDMRLPLSSDVERRSLNGITRNKFYSFGNMIFNLLMLYVVGIRHIFMGDTQ
ncbi:N-alpha-acetyltransferase 20 [Drosophila serrata]|uniref:N-alpha-acetyltransferase 20 n=1 Tax=Drosophila serrata TaxID=7274 RepID=UPI000A1D3825|nr:N-alpha-acetyltransferase 20 [Drosophila serrata]